MRNIIPITLLLLVSCSLPLEAQTSRERAHKAIRDLEKGYLVVSLPLQYNKIQKLQSELANPSLKEEKKAVIRKDIEALKHDNRERAQRWMSSFEKYYSFSKVLFIYDTAVLSVRQGLFRGMLLNRNLSAYSGIDINPASSFFIFHLGKTNIDNTTGVEAWLLADRNFKDLEPPFPYYVRANRWYSMFISMFTNEDPSRNSDTVVQKLQGQLSRYLKKVEREASKE